MKRRKNLQKKKKNKRKTTKSTRNGYKKLSSFLIKDLSEIIYLLKNSIHF